MLEGILLPVLFIGGLALIFGGLLGFSAKKFYVETDPRVEQITSVLPGANCGGCGFPGCAVFAEAVANLSANYKDCPVGGSSTAVEIAKTMGIEAVVSGREVAFVKCCGVEENVKSIYVYEGADSCLAAAQLAAGGNKSCSYGCLGLGSCKHACPFGAIMMVDGVAEIDGEKCTACKKCIAVCPKNLIEIVPEKSSVRVLCGSLDNGKTVRANCRSGCIACGLCKKACESEAVTVENNIARIDYEKCTLCMACVEKCPTKAIKAMRQ